MRFLITSMPSVDSLTLGHGTWLAFLLRNPVSWGWEDSLLLAQQHFFLLSAKQLCTNYTSAKVQLYLTVQWWLDLNLGPPIAMSTSQTTSHHLFIFRIMYKTHRGSAVVKLSNKSSIYYVFMFIFSEKQKEAIITFLWVSSHEDLVGLCVGWLYLLFPLPAFLPPAALGNNFATRSILFNPIYPLPWTVQLEPG